MATVSETQMASTAELAGAGTGGEAWLRRVGQVLFWLVLVFLLMDGVMHWAVPKQVVQAMAQLGVPVKLAVPIGILELVCMVLFVVPRTSVLGAVLLTGYLGGAVAMHMRVGNPVFEAYVFPAMIGAMIWGALLLRDQRLRRALLRRD